MENTSDALIMAGSVLILMVALSLTILSFSSLKNQTEEILSYRDEVQDVKLDTGEFFNYLRSSNDLDVRTVGIETILTSIKRLRKENYDLYIVPNFISTDIPNDLKTNAVEKVMYNDEQLIALNTEMIKFSLSGKLNRYYNNKDLYNNLLKQIYSAYKNVKFKEYIGIYQDATDEGVNDSNKATYKIITFVQTT